jgi:hypothetical protein
MDEKMLAKQLLAPILEDEVLTRDLGDAEARMLIEWLVEQADRQTVDFSSQEDSKQHIGKLCRWARGIAKFVQLWCYQEAHAAAIQLAGSEAFHWPLPATWMEPCDLMERILAWHEIAPTSYIKAAKAASAPTTGA